MLAVEQLLPKAARAFSTSAAAHQAAPAVATQGKGFLASLFGGGKRVDVPLTDALPGVVIPEAVAPPKDAPVTQLTKLSNGFTVATENTPVRWLLLPVPCPLGQPGARGGGLGSAGGAVEACRQRVALGRLERCPDPAAAAAALTCCAWL